MFYSSGPHYCKECPTWTNKKGRVFSHSLELIESNVSGCGYDIACCEECGKAYSITYRVDKMSRCPDWDGYSREEREKQQKEREEIKKQKQIDEAKELLTKHGIKV